MVEPSIFSKAFEVFDTVTHCQVFVWELPLGVKVRLSCNLISYILAIKRGHEFNLPSKGFRSKFHFVNFSVFFTDGDRLRRLQNDRSHFSLLLRMGKSLSFKWKGLFLFLVFVIFLCLFYLP